jgi:membrane protease YdiL (CAAX protease family)
MFFFSLFGFITWRFLLKKDVSIGIKTTNKKIILQTLLIVIVPLFAIIYFLSTSNDISYGLVTLMLLTSLATGVYEELIFRGITLGSLLHADIKPGKAIFISAIIFAFFHLFDAGTYTNLQIVFKLINTFIMGVVFAYIYYASNNIFYLIALHTVWDLESFMDKEYVSDSIGLSFPIILFAMSFLYYTWSCKQLKVDRA